MESHVIWREMFRFAGIAQLVLVIGSLWIPKVLSWKEQLEKNRRLLRQMFWIYAGYIWTTNLLFGVLSTFAPAWFMETHPMALVVCGYIFVYWLARCLLQFFVLDTSEVPTGFWHKAAKHSLTVLFVGLTTVYGWAFFAHLLKMAK